MFVGIGFITVPLAIFLYIRINNRRDYESAQYGDEGIFTKYTSAELRDLGDRAPDFRYTL